jgi:hypothetical protein
MEGEKMAYRVVVYPKDPFFGYNTDKESLDKCREIEAQIQRHVDGIGSTAIEKEPE